MQKSIQHERKVFSRKCYPSMLHDHFIDLPPILGKKKRKKNKYKVEKHHIYNTMTPIYTIIDSKKKTHTKQYYLKIVQLNQKKKKNQIKI